MLGQWRPRGVSLIGDFYHFERAAARLAEVANVRALLAGIPSTRLLPIIAGENHEQKLLKVLELWQQKFGTSQEVWRLGRLFSNAVDLKRREACSPNIVLCYVNRSAWCRNQPGTISMTPSVERPPQIQPQRRDACEQASEISHSRECTTSLFQGGESYLKGS